MKHRSALFGRLGLTAAMACAIAAIPALAEPVRSKLVNPPIFTDCRGARSAAPTVILESGAFGGSADWDRTLDDLAAGGRVCAYDRAGIGRSPARAGTQDVVSVAWELEGLLDQLGETAPVILVGHSNGGLYVETFAAIWPERVAGLVYVNAVGSDDLSSPLLVADLAQERRLAGLAVVAHGLGLAPAIARAAIGELGLTGAAAARKHLTLTSPRSLRVARDEDRQILPGLVTARDLGGSPASIPTVAIIGGAQPERALGAAWRVAEQAPAERARVSWILQAAGATHVSPLTRDRAWLVAAVAWLRSLPGPDVGH